MSAAAILGDPLSVAGPVFGNTAPAEALAADEGVTLRTLAGGRGRLLTGIPPQGARRPCHAAQAGAALAEG
jgi:hypothetical protein